VSPDYFAHGISVNTEKSVIESFYAIPESLIASYGCTIKEGFKVKRKKRMI